MRSFPDVFRGMSAAPFLPVRPSRRPVGLPAARDAGPARRGQATGVLGRPSALRDGVITEVVDAVTQREYSGQ
ncbi:protein of unknown function [Modestobacter italicus]|uniref:Uncharacterized protein n=1 Tax=Modestobacter italicus (strain DSM 44449 / CECT 9708 / BC 501) TaxID=2732864 RepID=I4ESP5_MODI5|nr:protein of unknown function [Modestobacter marinus]